MAVLSDDDALVRSELIKQGRLLLDQLQRQALAARLEARAAELQTALQSAEEGRVESLKRCLAALELSSSQSPNECIGLAEVPSMTIQTDIDDSRRADRAHVSQCSPLFAPALQQDATSSVIIADDFAITAVEAEVSDFPKSWDAMLVAARARRSVRHIESPASDVIASIAGLDSADAKCDECDEGEDLPLEGLVCTKRTEPIETERITKRRLSGFGISAGAHVIMLVVMAYVTLKLPQRAASLGFESMAADASMEVPETIELPGDVELSELELQSPAELQTTSSDAMVTDATAIAESMASSVADSVSTSTAGERLPTGPAQAMAAAASGTSGGRGGGGGPPVGKMGAGFFGVATGGNSFCYVVDSSGSMRGGAWDAAKGELFLSLRSLKETQRFFIVFFNAEVDALPEPGSREPAKYPLYAVPENIEHAVRWVETVRIGRGGPPNDALKLAIEREPDAIYLLTDGVTKVDVCEFLKKTNRSEDILFGDSVKVPIHAIAFYSLDGQDLLRRIAAENKGQFHYVLDPRKK
ncbi:MAG: hypothetical protein U0892_13035 [Pirellulales bacterium]